MTQSHQRHRPPIFNRQENYAAVTGASYTAKAGDQVIGVNRAGVVAVTPPSAEVRLGRIYMIKDESGSAATNNITIATEGSENIDGATTAVLAEDYGNRTIYSDGSNWFIVPIVHSLRQTRTGAEGLNEALPGNMQGRARGRHLAHSGGLRQ